MTTLNNKFWQSQSLLELRIKTFNRLLAAKAPEQMLRTARDQIMKSRAEMINGK